MDGLNVNCKIVFPVEDTVTVRLGTCIVWLIGRVRMYGVKMGFEGASILELLTALKAHGWVTLCDVRFEIFVGGEG